MPCVVTRVRSRRISITSAIGDVSDPKAKREVVDDSMGGKEAKSLLRRVALALDRPAIPSLSRQGIGCRSGSRLEVIPFEVDVTVPDVPVDVRVGDLRPSAVVLGMILGIVMGRV
jgi:hypothetical protein